MSVRVCLDEVLCLINSLPNKQCSLDPIPTWLLKKAAPNLAPFLVKLFNKSLSDGVFPQSFKTSYVTPILKKPYLDCGDTSSYRPISNLSVISKLLERSSGIGSRSNPLLNIYCGPVKNHRQPWAAITLLCRRHAGLWSL